MTRHLVYLLYTLFWISSSDGQNELALLDEKHIQECDKERIQLNCGPGQFIRILSECQGCSKTGECNHECMFNGKLTQSCNYNRNCHISMPKTTPELCGSDAVLNTFTVHYYCVPKNVLKPMCPPPTATASEPKASGYLGSPNFPYPLPRGQITCKCELRPHPQAKRFTVRAIEVDLRPSKKYGGICKQELIVSKVVRNQQQDSQELQCPVTNDTVLRRLTEFETGMHVEVQILSSITPQTEPRGHVWLEYESDKEVRVLCKADPNNAPISYSTRAPSTFESTGHAVNDVSGNNISEEILEPKDEPKKNNKQIIIIVIAVVGGLIVTAIIVAVIYIVRKPQKKEKTEKTTEEAENRRLLKGSSLISGAETLPKDSQSNGSKTKSNNGSATRSRLLMGLDSGSEEDIDKDASQTKSNGLGVPHNQASDSISDIFPKIQSNNNNDHPGPSNGSLPRSESRSRSASRSPKAKPRTSDTRDTLQLGASASPGTSRHQQLQQLPTAYPTFNQSTGFSTNKHSSPGSPYDQQGERCMQQERKHRHSQDPPYQHKSRESHSLPFTAYGEEDLAQFHQPGPSRQAPRSSSQSHQMHKQQPHQAPDRGNQQGIIRHPREVHYSAESQEALKSRQNLEGRNQPQFDPPNGDTNPDKSRRRQLPQSNTLQGFRPYRSSDPKVVMSDTDRSKSLGQLGRRQMAAQQIPPTERPTSPYFNPDNPVFSSPEEALRALTRRHLPHPQEPAYSRDEYLQTRAGQHQSPDRPVPARRLPDPKHASDHRNYRQEEARRYDDRQHASSCQQPYTPQPLPRARQDDGRNGVALEARLVGRQPQTRVVTEPQDMARGHATNGYRHQ